MIKLILLLILFSEELYPAINNLFNLSYNSLIYRAISITSFTTVLSFFAIVLYREKKVEKKMISIIFISAFIIVLMILSIAFYSGSSHDVFGKASTLKTILISFPSIFIAYILTKKTDMKFENQLLFINLLFTISFIKYLVININSNTPHFLINFGGVNYNDYGYIAALNITIGFFLLYINIKNNSKIKTLFLLSFNTIVSYLALIISGGRGAMILSIALLFLFLYVLIRYLSLNKRLKKTLYTLILLLLLFFIGSANITNNESIQKSFERSFGFIEKGQNNSIINWENTSGRKEIYHESWNLIKEKPLLGYGIGSVNYVNKRAIFSHNIFLDVFLEGGIFFLLGTIILFVIISIKSLKRIMIPKYYLLYSLFIYTFINLLSGTNYLIEPLFWFSITGILLLNENKKEKFINEKNNVSTSISSH